MYTTRTSGRSDARQIDAERGTPTRRAVHADIAPALTHDAIHRREAEPGPLTMRLGGEERLEQVRPDLAVHADARVRDAEQHVAPGRDGGRGRGALPVDQGVWPPGPQVSTLGHGVAGVHREVDEHLLDLSGVDPHRAQLGRQRGLEL